MVIYFESSKFLSISSPVPVYARPSPSGHRSFHCATRLRHVRWPSLSLHTGSSTLRAFGCQRVRFFAAKLLVFILRTSNFRWTGAGQVCCYDWDGWLMFSDDFEYNDQYLRFYSAGVPYRYNFLQRRKTTIYGALKLGRYNKCIWYFPNERVLRISKCPPRIPATI